MTRSILNTLSLLCLLMMSSGFEYANHSNSGAEFPQILCFRNDDLAVKWPKSRFGEFVERFDGYIPKLTNDERTDLPYEELQSIYSGLQRQHPEKLFLLHYNGEAVAVHKHKQDEKAYHVKNIGAYFPGHWAFGVGSLLKGAVSPSDQTLVVDDDSRFKMRDYVFHNAKEKDGDVSFPTDMVIVGLDAEGRRLWDQCEYVSLVSKADGKITVKRGQYGSTSRVFSADRAIVLPILGSAWASNTTWMFNFSIDCPRDSHGDQAADIYARKLIALVKGPKDNPFVEGIGLDLPYFSARSDIDSNHDNVVDGGYVNGVNHWRIGNIKLFDQLRAELGPTAILTGDSHQSTNQRAVGLLNGMESEGLVSHKDGYRGVATAINVHTYWQSFGLESQFSYIADKLMNPQDLEREIQMKEFAHGVSTVLGVGIGLLDPKKYLNNDEFTYLNGKKIKKTGWLGRPASGMKVLNPPGHVSQKGTEFIASAKVLNGRMSAVGQNEWLMKGVDEKHVNDIISFDGGQKEPPVRKGIPLRNVQLMLKDLDLRQGLTVKMDLKSEGTLIGLEDRPKFPRFVMATLSSDVKYEKNKKLNQPHLTCEGVMGAAGWHTNIFYFRAIPKTDAELVIAFEGLGDFRMRNVEFIPGPLILSREFNRGAVVVNLSEQKVSMPIHKGMVDVDSGNPIGENIELAPLDSRFLSREK